MSSVEFQTFRNLIYEHTRIDITENKQSMISTRILKRLQITQKKSFSEYIALIGSAEGKEEFGHFIDSITTNHTFFFREFSHFKFLREVVFPDWVKTHSAQDTFSIWSAASSTGEEAYSIAMTIDDWQERTGQKFPWHVYGSDISTQVLATATEGIYPMTQTKLLPDGFLQRYFQKGTKRHEGHIRVKQHLREHTSFTRINLFQPSYPHTQKFPVIFCRNAMIYFDPKTQVELVTRFLDHLEPGGYLFIGHSETLQDKSIPLQYVQPAILQKK